MRELKFRAWDKENQHMAYSDKHEWDYNYYETIREIAEQLKGEKE